MVGEDIGTKSMQNTNSGQNERNSYKASILYIIGSSVDLLSTVLWV